MIFAEEHKGWKLELPIVKYRILFESLVKKWSELMHQKNYCGFWHMHTFRLYLLNVLKNEFKFDEYVLYFTNIDYICKIEI